MPTESKGPCLTSGATEPARASAPAPTCPFHARAGTLCRRLARVASSSPKIPAGYARLRGLFSRRPLPPGDLKPLEEREQADQHFLLKQFDLLGPIWKAVAGHRLQICIRGIPRCRQFLKENAADLKPVTLDLEALFPGGFLRGMHGETHQKYRRALVRAIDPEVVRTKRLELMRFIGERLEVHATAQREHAGPAKAYARTLAEITSGLLMRVFFGAPFHSGLFADLMAGYRKLGPEGLEWWIGPEQRRHFFALRAILLQSRGPGAEVGEDAGAGSILHRLQREGALDETSLGQLIYMVEMGRFDLAALFRWLTKFAAEQPELVGEIAREDPAASRPGEGRAEAFVLETLRLQQSERVMRVANRDLVCEGFLIPRFSSVRLCMWESHKLTESFPHPFRFDPDRLLRGELTPDRFSPFGMDHHNCPFGDLSVQLAALFLRTLARGFALEAVGDGPAVRGRYHWQPAAQFTVRLHPRTQERGVR